MSFYFNNFPSFLIFSYFNFVYSSRFLLNYVWMKSGAYAEFAPKFSYQWPVACPYQQGKNSSPRSSFNYCPMFPSGLPFPPSKLLAHLLQHSATLTKCLWTNQDTFCYIPQMAMNSSRFSIIL